MKINNHEVIGTEFAYDGCHKIYILETEENKKDAIKNGYSELDFYPIEQIEEIFNDSCPLRFIYNWDLDTTYVDQDNNDFATFTF